MMAPKVTVLMPVYNGERYLAEAIESILAQTFGDFEFLIIDDGSTDESTSLLRLYTDPRIHCLTNDRNQGLAYTLNRGLELAQGEYIARMDCDDISLPERLRKQVQVMDACPEVGICGTWFQYMQSGEVIELPSDAEEVKFQTFHRNVLGHPTVMMRTALLRRYNLEYNSEFSFAQDYELWSRCYIHFSIINLPTVLLLYREHQGQMSARYGDRVWQEPASIKLNQLKFLNLVPSEWQEKIHLAVLSESPVISSKDTRHAITWIDALIKANRKTGLFEENLFMTHFAVLRQELLHQYQRHTFSKAWSYSLTLLKEFYLSPLQHYKHFDIRFKIILTIRCLVGKRSSS